MTTRNGEWPGGWNATQTRDRSGWLPGWDRSERCPPDPAKKKIRGKRLGEASGQAPAARTGGWSTGDRWTTLHRRRIQVIRALRRAGYVARRRWDASGAAGVRGHRGSSYAVQGGPVDGLPAIDPWQRADQLSHCCQSWSVSLYAGGSVAPLAMLEHPARCRRNHVCPVCAGVEAMRRAAAVRAVVGLDLDGGGPLALVTFTQRAHPEESLQGALARWRRGWALALGRGGRVARTRKTLIAGWYYGVEVTRGAEGKRRQIGRWWHCHGHAIVSMLKPPEVVRAWLARRWKIASAKAAEEAGIPGYGWDPTAGGAEGVELTGPWWVDVDRGDPVQVYQAAKYPTPAASLHPVPLAEFVAAAYRRQWHQAGGSLYGVMGIAEGLDVGEAMDDGDGDPRPDIGVRVSTDRPGTSPDPSDQGRLVWRWELRPDADPLALRPALVELGGRVELGGSGPVAVVPADAGRRVMGEINARIAAWRLVKDAARDGEIGRAFAKLAAEDILRADVAHPAVVPQPTAG